MNLTKDQIDELFLFTEKKMVHYYDLQVEIVDHLANIIERIMARDNSSHFEVALKQAYASFGLFGFAHIVREKERALQAKYKKMWWKEMIQQFKWPEILLSALILSVTWMLVNIVPIEILGSCFLAGWVACWILQNRYVNQSRKANKKLLMLQYDPMMNSVFLFLGQFVGWSFIYSSNPYLATAVFVSGVIIEIATFRLFRKMGKEARKLYPEAFLQTA